MRGVTYLVASLVCVCALPLQARDYHVDVAKGDDKNDGTSESPFKTINRAAKLAQAGDFVRVRAGIYREGVRPKNNGTAENPIRYVAEQTGKVIVTGADVVDAWQRLPGKEPIYKAPWTKRKVVGKKDGLPIEHHPSNAPLWGRTEQVIVDGKQLKPVASLAELRKNWQEYAAARKQKKRTAVLDTPLPNLGPEFAGMFAADTVDKKELYIWLADGKSPDGKLVESSARDYIFGWNPWANREGVEHVHVKGLIFRYGASFPQRGAVYLGGRNNLVEECIIEQMAGTGVVVKGTLRKCIIRNCGHTGGAASGSGFVNEDNVWEGNSWKPISRKWEAGAVKLARVDGGLFKRCLFKRNGGSGLWFDIDVRNVDVSECVFLENEGSGLFIEISSHIKATDNLAIRNAVGAVGKAKPGWSEAGIKVAESFNITLENNTCIMNKDGIAFREQGPRNIVSNDGQTTIPFHLHDNRVIRNLLAGNRDYQLGIWYDNSFFGWHPNEKKKYKTEPAWRASLKERNMADYDPRKQKHVINSNYYIFSKDQPPFLFGCPWRPRSEKYSNPKDYVTSTGFDSSSAFTAAPMPADPARIHPGARKKAKAMKAGWLNAPSNIAVWTRSFALRDPT